jgi:tRNA A-37 threonylcarbamoyl transferase component Bud32
MAGLEGKTLERYELRRLIGKGGMADVYEGYDLAIERTVAVKVFKREDEELLRRFIREARLMASLSHEHLVPIYDTGSGLIDGLTWYYIVMPFMEGGTLRARIRQAPLSLPEACRSLREIAEALDYIHRQGIIHRDIKSSNVLLDGEGHCYLSDFGIARTTSDATQLTSTGNVLGTVEYVAPELFEGNNRANVSSDLYSLGVLLFEMVTGRLPFTAENPIAVVTMHISKAPPPPHLLAPQISPAVEQVILKGLEKRPELRYRSAGALAEAFCQAVSLGSRGGVSSYPPAAGYSAGGQQPLILRAALQTANAANAVQTPPLPQITSYGAPYQTAPPYGPALPRQVSPRGRTSAARKRGLIVAALALIFLLLVSLPLALALTMQNGARPGASTATAGQQGTVGQRTATAPPNLTATAIAAASATARAQAQATQTASAGATATVEAQASATAGVWQTVTAGHPIYSDPLTDADNPATRAASWDQNSQCVFGHDGYHVVQEVSLTTSLHGCHEAAYSYQNLALSVQLKILSGQSGGVFVRLHTDFLNFYSGYLFEVDSQGRYRISNFSRGITEPFVDWTGTAALREGTGAVNTLEIIAKGSALAFYANGVYLTSINDGSYSDGNIGFLARTGETNADVVYSNLNIYAPA